MHILDKAWALFVRVTEIQPDRTGAITADDLDFAHRSLVVGDVLYADCAGVTGPGMDRQVPDTISETLSGFATRPDYRPGFLGILKTLTLVLETYNRSGGALALDNDAFLGYTTVGT
jgi:hypothetical protein